MHECMLVEGNANLAGFKEWTIVGARSKQGQNQKRYENHAEFIAFIKIHKLKSIQGSAGCYAVSESNQ